MPTARSCLADENATFREPKNEAAAQQIVEHIREQIHRVHDYFSDQPAEWYNQESNYMAAYEQVASLGIVAHSKFNYWRMTAGIGVWNIDALSLQHVLRVDKSESIG